MNATLTPRALAVIADSGETGEPIFRTPCSVGSGEVVDTEHLRADFERLANDSYGFKRSRFGTYQNPAVARDWKWFQLGAIAKTEGAEEAQPCESCDGTGRVVETIDVDVPGHNRAGSYQAHVTCPDCGGECIAAIAAATEGAA